jgi:hypothetical protein
MHLYMLTVVLEKTSTGPFPSRKLSCLLKLREGAKKGGTVAAGRDGGLFHLRWPLCRWKVSETVDLLPVGGVGPRLGFPSSRVKFPDLVGNVAASAMSRNKFSLDRPRPVGVPLRRRRRASGGGVPPVNPLYRSPGLVLRRPLLAAGLPAFCFKAVEQVLGVVVFWRLDQARASLDGCGRRR